MKQLAAFVLCACAFAGETQNLTTAQKEADFRYMASLFATYYAPYDWKKQLYQFDAFDLKPWLDRVARTQTDLDYYELCAEYVAMFKDSHVSYQIPSSFVARLGFSTDVYDGVLLIDGIDRNMLPAADYPFVIGDELLSIDGRPVQDLLPEFARYATQGNERATKRLAAARLTIRPQSRVPYASRLGDSAIVEIRRQSGEVETYTIPWTKVGVPLEVGAVPSPKPPPSRSARAPDELATLQHSGVLNPELTGLNGYGARNPIFLGGLPSTFTRRLGGAAADFFYSGTFKRGDLTIGYIRVPNYSPPSQTTALQQLDREIAYFEANTDGLIVDEMRNTGGNLCFGEQVALRLIPWSFQTTGFTIRPFWTRVLGFYNQMVSAKAANAPWETIKQYETIYNELYRANQSGQRLTSSLPLCTSDLVRQPLTGANGGPIPYTKPIMMLIDEFSTSTADSVASMFQDAQRGVIFGMRSNGAGGNNTSFDGPTYSETTIGLTLAIQTKKSPVLADGYPYTAYLENVGVHPDIVDDYMTKENLLRSGAPFVGDVLEAMDAYIRQRQ